MTANQRTLLRDAYRYAERLYILSHLLGACMLVAVTALILQILQLTEQPGMPAAVVAAVILAMVIQLAMSWLHVRRRLDGFELNAGSVADGPWQVAARRPGDPFLPVPRGFVARADEPAPAEACWELDIHAERYAEIRDQMQACRAVHGFVTRYDATNLMLLAVSLRNGEYATRLERSASSSHP